MFEDLQNLLVKAQASIAKIETSDDLAQIRLQIMGKKGELTTLLKQIGRQPAELRKELGQEGNRVKQAVQESLDKKEQEIIMTSSHLDGEVDLTLPGIKPQAGALHPITQMAYDLNDAFRSLGFEVFSEDDITSEKYAFDNLNFPAEHPARETMDTYWLKSDSDEALSGAKRLCLRPHLTGASVRYLKKHGAPARIVYPGNVFRNETTDARHERAFYQYEALIVDKDFSFSSGQLFIKTILEKVFGHDVPIRMRAGFFPFVEPGFEIDMQCQVCHGEGCKVCKQVGWIEIMPGGVPHPNVLKAAGLDPNEWSGFYINIGLDRLVMMRYGIDDVRLFRSSDLRFLQQFK